MSIDLNIIKKPLKLYEKDISLDLSNDAAFLSLLYSFQVKVQIYIQSKIENKEIRIYCDNDGLKSIGLGDSEKDISHIYSAYGKYLKLYCIQAVRDDVLESVVHDIIWNIFSDLAEEYFEKKLRESQLFLSSSSVTPNPVH